MWGAGLLVAVGAAGTMSLSTPLVAQTPWTELRGDGFVLRGPIALDRLTAVACDLDTAVRALRDAHGGTQSPTVVAVDNARGVREWLPQFEGRGGAVPLGAYWRGLYGHHIVVRVDARPEERLRRVLHEYAHFVTHLTHPDPPRWLDEGLSEVWEHVAITAGAIEIGRPVAEHLRRLRSGKGWMPVQELLSANVIPAANNSVAAMFYAQSWALVHYLMFEKSGGYVVLDRIPDPVAFPTNEELRAYALGPMASGVTIATGAVAGAGCPGRTVVRRVSHLETLLARAQALADGDRSDAAMPLLQEALQLDSGNVEALEIVGFVHFTGNRPAEAASVFDGLIAAGKGSYISFYYRAVLAVAVPERSDGGGPIPQVEYLRKAVGLNPGFAPAAQRLRELTGKKLTLALRP